MQFFVQLACVAIKVVAIAPMVVKRYHRYAADLNLSQQQLEVETYSTFHATSSLQKQEKRSCQRILQAVIFRTNRSNCFDDTGCSKNSIQLFSKPQTTRGYVICCFTLLIGFEKKLFKNGFALRFSFLPIRLACFTSTAVPLKNKLFHLWWPQPARTKFVYK